MVWRVEGASWGAAVGGSSLRPGQALEAAPQLFPGNVLSAELEPLGPHGQGSEVPEELLPGVRCQARP